MADSLKDFFDAEVVRAIARELRAAYTTFDERAFVRDGTAGLAALELTPRARHLAGVMHRYLPRSFPEASRVIVRSLGKAPLGEAKAGSAMAPFRYLPHVFFVATYGLDHFEPSMAAQYALTQRFTAEFSIRPFLERHPEATYARLREWASDPNVHVRRLVSEGTRPRLPWAPRLRAFQEDPRPVIALLELLKDDPERYVQRSVANNLNDIAKDHPDLAADVCRRWSEDAPPARRWIVKHALRSLVKRGHRGALSTLGVGAPARVRVARVRLAPAVVRIGGELRFTFDVTSAARARQDLMIDFAVHFVKANGGTRPKVFKLRRLVLEPREVAELSRRISFASMTTRTHHPGRHRIELLVNGVPRPLAEFDVRR